MSAFDDAKKEVLGTPARIGGAVRTFFGSRVAIAVTCAFAITFGCQLLLNKDEPAPLAGLSLVQIGLPPLELGRVGELADEAGKSAMRNGAPEAIAQFFDENPWAPAWFNGIGFALFALLFVWTLYLQARQYKRHPTIHADSNLTATQE